MQLAKVDAEMSYEEVCRAHVESLVAAAAAAAHQTALSTRVASWQAKVGVSGYASEGLTCLFNLNDSRLSVDVVHTGVKYKTCTPAAGQANRMTCHSAQFCGIPSHSQQLCRPVPACQTAL